ncbi:hypothetical protein B0T16DRAFT_393434 [Cercophora newfieldiana]|uniref:Uncharacterized protein n=1 Tax=Cercophora newfieldiana TaxID=92897 RepID=A0AA39XXA9_9PEZI|nr:hypothetical protein B0T16DRAFT_393434 [Cercophora newfieldiana]
MEPVSDDPLSSSPGTWAEPGPAVPHAEMRGRAFAFIDKRSSRHPEHMYEKDCSSKRGRVKARVHFATQSRSSFSIRRRYSDGVDDGPHESINQEQTSAESFCWGSSLSQHAKQIDSKTTTTNTRMRDAKAPHQDTQPLPSSVPTAQPEPPGPPDVRPATPSRSSARASRSSWIQADAPNPAGPCYTATSAPFLQNHNHFNYTTCTGRLVSMLDKRDQHDTEIVPFNTFLRPYQISRIFSQVQPSLCTKQSRAFVEQDP